MTAAALRILFLGSPDFAVPTLRHLLASRHKVVGVVTQPDRPRGRGQRLQPTPVKALALEHDVPVWQPDKLRDAAFLDAMRSLQPDLGVVAAYGKILPTVFLDVPRLGMINVHASLLPRWRGASPIQRAVAAGDAATGVTIMRVVAALDAGAMFARVVRPIGDEETAGDVEKALADLGAALLVDVVDQIAAGTATETPQDESLVTYAPRLTREDGVIDWARPADTLACFVRGMQPWPGATTTHMGQRWLIRRAAADASDAGGASPGTVLAADGDTLRIACGSDTVLAVSELQPEGRRTMRVREYLAGHAVTVGAVLGREGTP